jgi:prevent-host-death family protein
MRAGLSASVARDVEMSPNHKGALAEAMICAHAISHGIDVLKPVAEHGRYDLAFDLGDRIWRVQCKWGKLDLDAGVISARTGTSRHTPQGYVVTTYSPEEVDAIAIYCDDLQEVFLVPIAVAGGKRQLHLRIQPPRNGQLASINLAGEYQLGAVAQLGERSAGSRKVVGSNPISSTPSGAGQTTVGAHEFRNLFGHYMERAEAGERILVTRRGRPAVRLVPA